MNDYTISFDNEYKGRFRDQIKEKVSTLLNGKMYPVKWTLNKKCYTHWVLLCDN